MIDAYTIGITLALDDGVSAGVAAIRRELAALDLAISETMVRLAEVSRMGRQVGLAGMEFQPSVPPIPARKSNPPLENQPAFEPVGPGTAEPNELRQIVPVLRPANIPAPSVSPSTQRQSERSEPAESPAHYDRPNPARTPSAGAPKQSPGSAPKALTDFAPPKPAITAESGSIPLRAKTAASIEPSGPPVLSSDLPEPPAFGPTRRAPPSAPANPQLPAHHCDACAGTPPDFGPGDERHVARRKRADAPRPRPIGTSSRSSCATIRPSAV